MRDYLTGLAEQALGIGAAGAVLPRPVHPFEHRLRPAPEEERNADLEVDAGRHPALNPHAPGTAPAPRIPERPIPPGDAYPARMATEFRPEPPFPSVYERPAPEVTELPVRAPGSVAAPMVPARPLTVRPVQPDTSMRVASHAPEAPSAVPVPLRPASAPSQPAPVLPRVPAVVGAPFTGSVRPLVRPVSPAALPPPEPPTVQVTIGRLEVRLTTGPAPAAARTPAPAPATLSLEQYLKDRDGKRG